MSLTLDNADVYAYVKSVVNHCFPELVEVEHGTRSEYAAVRFLFLTAAGDLVPQRRSGGDSVRRVALNS